MPDASWSFIARTAVAACALAGLAAAAAAQPVDPPASADIMTRYDFHLSAASLAIDDARFSWDTRFGGDVDLVDYVVGRARLVADYEAILGRELRAFDPNQSYYLLEPSLSVRVGRAEVAFVFHHVSRHLSDRPKPFSIAWNAVGARVLRRIEWAGTIVDVDGAVGGVVQHAYVDYRWTADGTVSVRRAVRPRVGVFGTAHGEAYGVGETSHRDRQLGVLLEGGLRVGGPAGAVELFAGYERRVDADPIALRPQRWALAGFRFVR